MGTFRTSAEALVEIISLCEQTLTALHRDHFEGPAAGESDQDRRPTRRRRSKFVRHLFLIRGGLWKSKPPAKSRSGEERS
jgi:hypothetical protein